MLNIEKIVTMRKPITKIWHSIKYIRVKFWDQLRAVRGKQTKIDEIIRLYIEEIFSEV